MLIPKGYILVPIEPTKKMIEAGEKHEHFEGGYGSYCTDFWNSMIEAYKKESEI